MDLLMINRMKIFFGSVGFLAWCLAGMVSVSFKKTDERRTAFCPSYDPKENDGRKKNKVS
jgi:hypothetical protein